MADNYLGALEEQRARKADKTCLDYSICLKCFDKAEESFKPNVRCRVCQCGFMKVPLASTRETLPRTTTTTKKSPSNSSGDDTSPEVVLDTPGSSIFLTVPTAPSMKLGKTSSPGVIERMVHVNDDSNTHSTETGNGLPLQGKTAGAVVMLDAVGPDLTE